MSWTSGVLAPVIRPAARFIVGLLAIPLLRALRRRLRPNAQWDEEFEKDLEHWVRASLILMLATKNVEMSITAWVIEKRPEISLEDSWWFAAGRLLLAIGVIESMPDQQLFSIIHPGPPRLRWIRGIGLRENFRRQAYPFLKGVACLHLNRSSPVFVILSVLFEGTIGWVFFSLAITQYLIIALVTSRDKAIDILSQFDHEVAQRRKAILDEIVIPAPELEIPERKSSTSESKTLELVTSGLMAPEILPSKEEEGPPDPRTTLPG